jgi:hypothetical protein
MKYLKTDAGMQAFKARSTLLSTRQRSVFILFDGVKSGDQVLTVTAGLGVTQYDIDHLVQQGFLLATTDSVAAVVAPPSATAATTNVVSTRSPQERYMAAMPIATRLTAGMGLRGFRLNLAIEAARGFDDLSALLPKIQDAVGVKACIALEKALND